MIDKDSDTSSIEGEKSGLSTVLRSPIIKSEETVVTVDIDDGNTSEAGNPKERFIPDHKKPDAAITFPEKLMNLMKAADKHDHKTYCVAWLPDGKSFIIRNPEQFTKKVLVKYFKATKFSSFTRKLYRWGFRQVNRGIGPDEPIVFGNDRFQRDNEELMKMMRSVTAAATRKREKKSRNATISQKAELVSAAGAERKHNRTLLDQLLHHEAVSLGRHAMLGPAAGSLNMNLAAAAALRSNLRASAFGGSLSVYGILGQRLHMNPLLGTIPMHHPNVLNSIASRPQHSRSASTADVVGAAIGALRYAS